MICKKFQDEMSEYLDGLLDKDDRERFEKHLSECLHCRQETEELRDALRWIKKAEPVSPPSDLRSLVIGRLRAEQKNKKRSVPGLFQGVAAAAVLLFLIAGNLLPQYYEPVLNDAPGVFTAAESYRDGADLKQENALSETETADGEIIRQAAEESPPAVIDDSNVLADEGASARPFLSLRLILNLILIPLFFLFLVWGIKKRKEALL